MACGTAQALLVDLTVDSSQSSVTINVDAGLLGGSDSDTSVLSGTSSIDLTPAFEPFSTAEVTALDLTLDDSLSFSLNFGVSASTTGGDITVTQTASGGAAAVSGGMFTQTGNTLALTGTVAVSIADDIDLASQTLPLIDYNNATISQVGANVTVNVPLDVTLDPITGVPVIGTVNVSLTGNVVATGVAIKLGDLDMSGMVNETDLGLFIDNWREDTTGLTELEAFKKGDMNFDGITDLADFGLFRTGYLEDNPGASLSLSGQAIPEPSTLALALGGLLAIATIQRRRQEQ